MSTFCFAPQTGPMPQSSVAPSRTTMARAAATSRSVSSAAVSSSTMTRLVDVHHCPEQAKAPLTISATARSRSASGSTIAGFLPPSSSCVASRLRAAASWIDLPTGVEPVNEIALMRTSPTSAVPTVPPLPVTQLMTPGGNPLAASSSVNRSPVRGVKLAGFRTTVLPPISAGVRLAARHVERKIPRRHERDGPERFARRVRERTFNLDGHGLSAQPHAFGNLVVHLLDRRVDLAPGFAQRLAVLARDDGGDLVAARDHRLQRAVEISLALERRQRAPRRERSVRSRDGSIDVGRATSPRTCP